MFVEKDPPKSADARKAREILAKEPAPDSKKKGLQGMGYDEQVKKVSPRVPEGPAARLPAASGRKDPVAALKQLFRENDLPDRLVPSCAVDFRYDPASGALSIVLKSGFTRKFDAESTLTFDRTLSGVLRKGSFSGIEGISRGGTAITSIARSVPGQVAILGRSGPSAKTMEFRDEALPSLP